MDDRIEALTAQLEKLQAENTFLKHILDEAGISYVLPLSKPAAEITKQLARRFYSYFWGRTDVYSKRSVNLLSRDDVEDNIMRLESQEVAEELLGMAWDVEKTEES